MIDDLTIRNKRTLQEIDLSVYNIDYILDSATIEPIQAQLNSISGISQDGETITKVKLETRDISITGWLVFDDSITLKEHERNLTKFINPKEKFELITNNRKIEFNPTSTVKLGTGNNEDNEIMRKFLIQGVCDLPFFTDEQESKTDISTEIGNFEFPLHIPPEGLELSIRTISFITNVYNQGDVNAPIKVKLKATGTVINPIIENLNTGEFIRVKRELAEGDTLEISTAFGNKRVEIIKPDGNRENVFHYIDYKSTFFSLSGGDNTIKYDAEVGENNLDVSIYYTPRYLGE